MPQLDMDAVRETEKKIDNILFNSMRILFDNEKRTVTIFSSDKETLRKYLQLFFDSFMGKNYKSYCYQKGIAWRDGFEECVIISMK